MSIVLQPLGCDSWDGVVLLGGSLRNTGQARGDTSLHRLQDRWVNRLVQSNGLLYRRVKQAQAHSLSHEPF